MIRQVGPLTNDYEPHGFLRAALSLKGSVTPNVFSLVLVSGIFSAVIVALVEFLPALSIPITPFEYSGAALSLLLVLRVNAGQDRWWEARKIWGSIVNQSRNLAIIGLGYGSPAARSSTTFLAWVAAWPHVIRESLRREKALNDAERLIGRESASELREAAHMPSLTALRVAQLLSTLRAQGLDDFAFQRAERERALLIDAVGACERIRDTPMPLALAIKTRRLILLFLLLLPLGLVERTGWLTPLFVMLASYPLFSLDEIGRQLQQPFSKSSVSHLPLETICGNIERHVLSLAAPAGLPDPLGATREMSS